MNCNERPLHASFPLYNFFYSFLLFFVKYVSDAEPPKLDWGQVSKDKEFILPRYFFSFFFYYKLFLLWRKVIKWMQRQRRARTILIRNVCINYFVPFPFFWGIIAFPSSHESGIPAVCNVVPTFCIHKLSWTWSSAQNILIFEHL